MSFARVWSRRGTGVVILVLTLVLIMATPEGERDAPFRMTAVVAPLLLLAGLVPVLLTDVLATPTSFDETFPGTPGAWYRLCWIVLWTILLLAATTVGSVALGRSGDLTLVLLRNVLFGSGVMGLSSAMLPAAAAWAPLTLYLLLCWSYGTSDLTSQPYPWALPLFPAHSVPVLLVTAGAVLSGFAIFALRAR